MITRRAVLLSLVGLLLGLPVWATDNTPPEGFVSLFNGKDLLGWKAPAGDNGHWKVVEGVIDYDAQSEAQGDKSLWSDREYGDFILRVDWRLKEAPFLIKGLPDRDPPRPEDNVRALLITGGHEHETSFYSLFDGYKDLGRVPVSSSDIAFQSDLRGKYDVLIMYDFSRDLNETGRKNLRDFVEGGKGIVVLHHALLNYQKWSWWYEDVVGGSYRLQKESDNHASSYKGDQQIFVVPEGKHPITAALEPFQALDETYKNMWLSPRARPLLITDNPNSDRLLAWIGPCATSRVVAIQLGHGPAIFSNPEYRTMVHKAILWSAGRLK